MQKLLAVALVVLAVPAFAKGSGGHHGGSYPGGSHAIRGYERKDGTYVAPSHATNPDRTKLNNWSSKGNVNPYTGKAGTKDPYK